MKIEVCTWDHETGVVHVDHTWRTQHHNGRRKVSKLRKRVNRWLARAVKADHDSDHVVYVRLQG